MNTLLYSLAFVLNIALPLTVQTLDKRRLTDRQRARVWNRASWGSALYVAGILSMIPWAWVTRNEWARWREAGLGWALGRSVLLLAAGLGVALLLYGIVLGVLTGLSAALGLPDLD